MKVTFNRGAGALVRQWGGWIVTIFIVGYVFKAFYYSQESNVDNTSTVKYYGGSLGSNGAVSPSKKPSFIPEKVFPSKILVVNGAGYIGSHVAKHFFSLGHDVTTVDTLSSPNTYEKALKTRRERDLKKIGIDTFRGQACHSYFLGHVIDMRAVTHVVFAPPSFSSQEDFTALLVCFGNIAQTISNHRRPIRLVYGVAGATLKKPSRSHTPKYEEEEEEEMHVSNIDEPVEYIVSRSHHNLNKVLSESMASIARLYQNSHQLPVVGLVLPEISGDVLGPGNLYFHVYEHISEGTPILGYSDALISTISMEQCLEAFTHLLKVRYLSHVLVTIDRESTEVKTLQEVVDAMYKEYYVSNKKPSSKPDIIIPKSPAKELGGEGEVSVGESVHRHGPILEYGAIGGIGGSNGVALSVAMATSGGFSGTIKKMMSSLAESEMFHQDHQVLVQRNIAAAGIPFEVLEDPDKFNPKDSAEVKAAISKWFNRGGGAGRAVVFSCYFNKKIDPQRGQFLADDNFKYIEKWYLSVVEKDLYAVIFHDGLSSEFLRKYSTKKITFHHVALGERSTNDERFFFYYKYLSEHPEITAVVMTDISDVVIQNDPFEFMMLTGDYIYAGRDYGNKMEDNGWLTPRERVCFVKGFDKEEHRLIKKKSQVYNAGVVGGYTDTMIEFLGEMTYYLSLCPIKFNCNMPVYNFVLHRSFETRIFSGFPWNSRFFMKEKDPLGVYIIHK